MGLFSLFGPKKPKGDPYWVFDKDNHFKPTLDKGDFYKLSRYDFGLFVLEPIFQFLGERKYEIERSQRLSYGQKALCYWWYVDAQVLNGGFTQYYFNNYGKYTPTVIKALNHIGDNKMAELINRSYELYLKKSKKIKDARLDGLEGLSGLYKQIEDFDGLDTEYYHLKDRTMKNIENYIRKHPDEICLDQEGKEFDMKFSGELKSFYAENKLKQSFIVKKGIIDGAFNSYYENGKQKELIHYSKGKQTGERDEYYENGNLKYTIRKNLALNQFEHLWYHENGNRKKLEHKLIDKDERIGEYKEWHDNGQLAESAVFIAAIEREGWWLKYHRDGSKKMEAEFKDGNFLLHNCWNENGEQTLRDGTGLYVSDFSSARFHNRYEQEYKDYKRHGKQYIYTNGVLSVYYEMENDKSHGITKSFYENGKLREESLYENGNEVWKKKY
jgi:antitoxin component YwqK of YwqJK toxin-antitoxin module